MNDISADDTDIEAVLSLADAKLGKLIEAVVSKIGRLRITAAPSSPFEALTRAIIYQQMSAGAAATIYKKLQQSIKGVVTPKEVLALPHDVLRAVGLSKSKAQYVHNLAEWFVANPDHPYPVSTGWVGVFLICSRRADILRRS
jgi:3-methyladenine DNA glycosylase/8-oxoguanine DNA glycosylase